MSSKALGSAGACNVRATEKALWPDRAGGEGHAGLRPPSHAGVPPACRGSHGARRRPLFQAEEHLAACRDQCGQGTRGEAQRPIREAAQEAVSLRRWEGTGFLAPVNHSTPGHCWPQPLKLQAPPAMQAS